MSAPGHVVIAGGGLAGIAAAVRLAQRGVQVTLLETRKKLGGRATSFVDVRSGETLDNCQHVVLGCCTNYLDLMQRLGVRDQLVWTREQYWMEKGGRTSVIRPAAWLAAPGHFSMAVLRAKFLTMGEKVALAKGMLRIMRVDRRAWASRTFAEFLKEVGQPTRLIEKFWSPVIVSACNLDVERCAASSALQVFQEGFLASATAADMGLSRVPLVQLYDRAEEFVTRAGGAVRLGVSVEAIHSGAASARVRTSTGEVIEGDRVICALPPERAAEVLVDTDDATRRVVADLRRIEHSPILGVHLRFDRGVMATPHAVLVDARVQWLFRKDDEGRAIHAVISAADAWVGLDEGEITRRVMEDVTAYLPRARGAKLLSSRPVKEKRATFAVTPMGESLRPAASALCGVGGAGGVNGANSPGVILAGDATQTGWPATMEGAVRSGYVAAGLAMGEHAGGWLIADQQPARLARMFGLKQQGGVE